MAYFNTSGAQGDRDSVLPMLAVCQPKVRAGTAGWLKGFLEEVTI
jgi:hypothetical protein